MKITKKQLVKLIKEEVELVALPQELSPKNDKEIGMAVNQLQAISVTAIEISELVKNLDHVPEWGDGKISTVLDNLESIRSYLLGKSIGRE